MFPDYNSVKYDEVPVLDHLRFETVQEFVTHPTFLKLQKAYHHSSEEFSYALNKIKTTKPDLDKFI
jgi:hypothetical protein